jgi:hypothetical protein
MNKILMIMFIFFQSVGISQAQTSLNLYLKRLSQSDEKTILLVGSGAHYERGRDPNIFTFDISPFTRPNMIGDITKRKDTQKIPDESFDMVELEHLPSDIFHEGAAQTFTELFRILKPGGYLKFNDMTEWTTGATFGPFMCSISGEDLQRLRHANHPNSDIQRKITDLSDETTALFFFKLGYSWIKHVDGYWYLFKK